MTSIQLERHIVAANHFANTARRTAIIANSNSVLTRNRKKIEQQRSPLFNLCDAREMHFTNAIGLCYTQSVVILRSPFINRYLLQCVDVISISKLYETKINCYRHMFGSQFSAIGRVQKKNNTHPHIAPT